jgi:integrase
LSGRKPPTYRRHSSSDRGFVERDGKRHYLPGAYKSPESLDAYGKFIREQCGGLLPDMPPAQEIDSVAIIIDGFLAYAERRYPAGTYQNLEQSVLPLQMVYGSLTPQQFGPKKLKEWQLILAEKKLSRDYINDCCRRIRQMFKWAVGEELIPAAIHHALTLVPGLKRGQTQAVEHPPRKMVQKDVVDAILPHLSPTVRAMIELQWLTGVRSQSLCLAKHEQFRLDVLPWEWRPRHKQEHTGGELVVHIGPKARAVLAPFLAIPRPLTGYLFRPRVARDNPRYGSFYSSGSFRQAILRGIERANALRASAGLELIQRWTPHRVRHSRSTLTREVHGLEAAQAVIGHRSIEAAQIYAERQTKEARRIAEFEG